MVRLLSPMSGLGKQLLGLAGIRTEAITGFSTFPEKIAPWSYGEYRRRSGARRIYVRGDRDYGWPVDANVGPCGNVPNEAMGHLMTRWGEAEAP